MKNKLFTFELPYMDDVSEEIKVTATSSTEAAEKIIADAKQGKVQIPNQFYNEDPADLVAHLTNEEELDRPTIVSTLEVTFDNPDRVRDYDYPA